MTALTTEYHPDWKCYITHTGGDEPFNSGWIGEGRTPEDSRSDYWSQANGDVPTARLYADDDGEFFLYNGRTSVRFDDKTSAIAYADARNWII